MKKLLAMALAVVMVMAMSVSVFAAEADESPVTIDNLTKDEANIPVIGRVDSDGDGILDKDEEEGEEDLTQIFAVDISWTDMEFIYTAPHMEWDPDELKYHQVEAGEWSNNTETITVTNKSNVAIDATATFAKNEEITDDFGLTIKVTDGEGNVLNLGSAAVNEDGDSIGVSDIYTTGTEQTGTFDVTVNASAPMSVNFADGDQLGMITVTVAEAE